MYILLSVTLYPNLLVLFNGFRFSDLSQKQEDLQDLL